jgi:hypothetical protein
MGREQPTGNLDKTVTPQTTSGSQRRVRTSGAHLRSGALEPANGRGGESANGRSSEHIGLQGGSELNTGNDLRPLEQTGFLPAIEKRRAEEEGDETTGSGTVPADLTMPPRPSNGPSGHKPKIVIGDAVQYSGATVVGPSPLAKPAEDEDEGRGAPATRVFKERPSADDGAYDDRTDGGAEGLEDEATGSDLDSQAGLSTAGRLGMGRKAGMTPQQRKVAIIGGGVTVLLIAVLAVVAVMMLGSNPGQLYVRIQAPDGTPGGQFSVRVSPPGKTYDGEKAISLDPGDYNIEVIPSSKALDSARQQVHIGAGETRPLLIKLKPVGPAGAKAGEGRGSEAAPKPGEASAGQKPGDSRAGDTGAGEKPGEAKRPEGKGADSRGGEQKVAAVPGTYTVVFSSDEPGVEVMLDGKRVGKTPDLKVPGLQFDRQHKAVASKPGFRTINLVIENPDKRDTLDQSLTMVRDEPPAKEPKEPRPTVAKEDKPSPRKDEPPKEAKPLAAREEKPPPKKEEVAPKREEPAKEAAAKEQPGAKKGSKTKGKFACATKPLGAEVWVDGKNTGEKTPISLSKAIDLPVGKHKVTFKLNGRTIGPFDIDVTEEEVAKLTGKTFD